MIVPVAKREVKNVPLETLDRDIGFEFFMDGISAPSGGIPVEQADFPVRIPPGVPNPGTHVGGDPRHRPGSSLSRTSFPLLDVISQLNTQPFVGIETENPVMASLRCSEILLSCKSFPGMNNH